MVYTPENIGRFMAWYELLDSDEIWGRVPGMHVLWCIRKISNVFKALRFERPYKTTPVMLSQLGLLLSDIENLQRIGLVNLVVDGDTIVVAPKFMEIGKLTKRKTKQMTSTPEAVKLCDMFIAVQEKYMKIKPNKNAWAVVFDKMLKHVPYDHIKAIIETLPRMSFWFDKVLSPQSMVKHYNQLDREWNKINGKQSSVPESKIMFKEV